MGSILDRVTQLVGKGEVRISEHGYEELAKDNIFVRDVVAGLSDAALVEEYPDYPKGPCVLALQWDRSRSPIHAVWGIPKGTVIP